MLHSLGWHTVRIKRFIAFRWFFERVIVHFPGAIITQFNLGHCFNTTFLGMAGRSSFAKAYQFNRKFGQLSGRCLEEALRSRLQKLEVPAAKADAGLLQMRLASGSHCGPPPVQ